MIKQSLRNNYEFKRVYKKGKSIVTPYFVIYSLNNHFGINRIGFTVSKKIGNAVNRNRARRRLKECLKDIQLPNSTSFDFVIVARSLSKTAKFSIMRKCMRDVMGKFQ